MSFNSRVVGARDKTRRLRLRNKHLAWRIKNPLLGPLYFYYNDEEDPPRTNGFPLLLIRLKKSSL